MPSPRVVSAAFIAGAVEVGKAPGDGLPEVAFSGRSNVGKSSLINRLVQRKRLARTSSTPGKTQQLNYYRVNDALYLVDLPGYGYVRGGANLRRDLGRLTEGYLKKRATLAAVVQLLDARHDPSELDLMMADWLRRWGKPFLLVFTKIDKLSRQQLQQRLETVAAGGQLSELPYATFSAVSGAGRQEIWEWVVEQAGLAGTGPHQDRAQAGGTGK
ncbi:MAG: ribosome biogenesis GTP-binding protein YihA/YsxC [Gemmatimonadota bacterium]